MKSVLMIALKGIFKRKSYTIAIFLLAIIAAVSMATALSTIFRIQSTYDAAFTRSKSPDMLYCFADNDYNGEYVDFFKSRDEVKSVSTSPLMLGFSVIGSINGNDISTCMFQKYSPDENLYKIERKSGTVLGDNEVYVPLLFKSEYQAKIGDKFILRFGKSEKSYTIVGFLEDPCYGSVFLGIKRFLFSAEGYRQASAFTENKTMLHNTMLNVNLKDQYQGEEFNKTVNALNKDFGKDMIAMVKTDKSFLMDAALVIPKIISIILLCFSALLIIIVAVVIRHAILSSIEADYVTFGVLKAIGFTGRDTLLSILLQYLIVSGAGTVLGIAGAIFATPVFGEILISTTGIFWSGGLTAPIGLLVFFAILGFIGLTAFLTARKTAKISPMRAISFGKAAVHFSARINAPLSRFHFLPIGVKLPFKQMVTRLRQYSTLILITTIFTFMMITITTAIGNFNTDEKMYKVFGLTIYDMDITAKGENVNKLNDVVRDIDKTYGLKQSGSDDEIAVKLDGSSAWAFAKGNFEQSKDSLLEGSLPKYDNEIIITPALSSSIGKDIGDTVELEGKTGIKKKYIIVGKMQCIYEMGRMIALSINAYQKIDPSYKPEFVSVILNDNHDLTSIISTLKQKYPNFGFKDNRNETRMMFNTINSAISAASAIVNVLTLILIACITILLCTITIYREETDTGIFKAIGFKNRELRFQFTFRFILISVLGGSLGAVLGILLGEQVLKTMLFSVGIAQLKPIWNFASLGFPLLFVIVVTALTSFLCSHKIKSISPSNLISE